jgi:hypothetical protein
MGLLVFLEDLLGCRVDVVTAKGLKPRLRPLIDQDLVRVALPLACRPPTENDGSRNWKRVTLRGLDERMRIDQDLCKHPID